jgi:hypothetical protein
MRLEQLALSDSFLGPQMLPITNIQPIEQLPTCHKKQHKFSREKMLFKWSNKFNFPVDIPQYSFKEIAKEIFTPYEYFKMFFKDEIFELIVTNTNLYSSQNFENPITTNVDEIRNYIGIELLMSIVSMPAYTDFWSTNLRYEPIASVMPLKRYQLLRRQLHFVDNLTIDQSDRHAKIRPIIRLNYCFINSAVLFHCKYDYTSQQLIKITRVNKTNNINKKKKPRILKI